MSHRSKEEHGGRLFRRKSMNFGKTEIDGEGNKSEEEQEEEAKGNLD
jgi:hypothetical protein